MMDISAVVEGLTHDVLRFLISLFEGIFYFGFVLYLLPAHARRFFGFGMDLIPSLLADCFFGYQKEDIVT